MQLLHHEWMFQNSVIKPPSRLLFLLNEIRTKSLGHRKGRTYFPIQKRFKPLLLLLGVAVASKDLWAFQMMGVSASPTATRMHALYPCCQCRVRSSSSP